MNQTKTASRIDVPPEEIQRRIAEYRRLGYEHRSPAIMVYPAEHQTCPWPDCDRRIAGVRFNLDRIGDPERTEELMASFWQGPGLVGRCPGCGRYVLFGYEAKERVPDPARHASALLPDDWGEKADLSPRSTAR
jgi:hypothetical protein